MSNIITANFGGKPFRDCGELAADLDAVLKKYEGRLSLAEGLGVLEIIKMDMIRIGYGGGSFYDQDYVPE